eukprot:COSAG03_NODE_3250_length_2123_cov_1.433794_2_plen_224_part_00
MPIARCGIRAAVFTRGARTKLVRQNVPRTVSAVASAALTKDARVLVSYPLASLWAPVVCCKHAHTEGANTRGDYIRSQPSKASRRVGSKRPYGAFGTLHADSKAHHGVVPSTFGGLKSTSAESVKGPRQDGACASAMPRWLKPLPIGSELLCWLLFRINVTDPSCANTGSGFWIQLSQRGGEIWCGTSGNGPVPHKDFSDLYAKMSGKGASASEAHRRSMAHP